MNIFKEVKERVSARDAAEFYGLKVSPKGLACCPFHHDRHPSMKIDTYYYCFACGAKGDAVNYVSSMFGLTPYESAVKICDDFHLTLPVDEKPDKESQKKFRKIKKEKENRHRKMIRIQKKFHDWCNLRINELKACNEIIQNVRRAILHKPPEMIMESDDFATLLHAEPLVNY